MVVAINIKFNFNDVEDRGEEQQLAHAEKRPRVNEEAFANPNEKGGT